MDKNIRICIIGGGPAGLSAGMYLEQKGYENYTILERNDRVGGKCWSPHFNGGRRYEMGAIMGCPTYYTVHDVEKFCGITHDGPPLLREYKNKEGKVIEPFNPKKNILKIPQLLKMKKQVKVIAQLLETKYKGYDLTGHRGVAQGRYIGFKNDGSLTPVEGVNENLKDLALPFKEFCELNHVELIQNIWIAPFTAFGYGYFDELPAAYVLKYLDFATAMYFINGNLWTWKEGTQSIWEALNDHIKHPARLNSQITNIERKDGKVLVTVNGEVEEYDKLIVTAPLQYLHEYCDVREDEQALFSKIDFERYDVCAVNTKPENLPRMSYYIFENMVPERLGHMMVSYRRWNDDDTQPITTYILRKHKNSKEIPYEEGKKMALTDLATMGNPHTNIINEWSTYYCPHVFTEDYANGWYDKVEDLQGKYDTYYAGEVMSFGDMEETATYSRELVERFF